MHELYRRLGSHLYSILVKIRDAVNPPVTSEIFGEDDEPLEELELNLEWLHRYNILSCQSRLLCLLQGGIKVTTPETVDHLNQELDRYSTAIRNFRSFRDEDKYLFAAGALTGPNNIVAEIARLEKLKLQGTSESGTSEQIKTLSSKIERVFGSIVNSTTSGLTAQRKAAARKALWSRLFMALGGGLVLVGPMLVMILHPTKLTTILTTSCCVIAVGVLLALFMVDSHPKDVLACTATYAAVLVVFVGAGGGTA